MAFVRSTHVLYWFQKPVKLCYLHECTTRDLACRITQGRKSFKILFSQEWPLIRTLEVCFSHFFPFVLPAQYSRGLGLLLSTINSIFKQRHLLICWPFPINNLIDEAVAQYGWENVRTHINVDKLFEVLQVMCCIHLFIAAF